jgi:hypothetical protein
MKAPCHLIAPRYHSGGMSADGDHRADEPLTAAGRAFEDHERELLEELMQRVWRDIPPGATVAEIERAALEEDEARELLERVQALAKSNDGYLRSHFTQPEAPAETTETQYEFSLRGTPQGKEAIELMRQLQEEFEKRLPAGLSAAGREERIKELLTEDPRLAEMGKRLDQLFRDGPS